MVMELKAGLFRKSLLVPTCWTPPGKTRSSPGLGAAPPTQLAELLHKPSPPPPDQRRVAGSTRSSRRKSVPGRKVGRPCARARPGRVRPRNHLRHAAWRESDIASVLSDAGRG